MNPKSLPLNPPPILQHFNVPKMFTYPKCHLHKVNTYTKPDSHNPKQSQPNLSLSPNRSLSHFQTFQNSTESPSNNGATDMTTTGTSLSTPIHGQLVQGESSVINSSSTPSISPLTQNITTHSPSHFSTS